jgi:hypothetical protein
VHAQSALLFYVTFGIAAQLLLLAAVPALKYTAPGPYAIIFALLVHYRFDVPALSHIGLTLLSVTDKIGIYVLSAQLLFAYYPASLLTGLTGLLAGLVYRFSPACQRVFRVPDAVARCCARLAAPLLSSSASQAEARAEGYAPVNVRIRLIVRIYTLVLSSAVLCCH